MHAKKPKKAYPSQNSCNPLVAIIVSHVHKTTRPLPKFRAAKPTQQTVLPFLRKFPDTQEILS